MAIQYPRGRPAPDADSSAGSPIAPVMVKKVTSRDRLNFAITVSVDERTIWTGRTGGPIRNSDFHEGQMLIELASALEETVEKFKTMLQLHADPMGWMSSMGIFFEPQLREALNNPALDDAAARAEAAIGSTAELPDEPVVC